MAYDNLTTPQLAQETRDIVNSVENALGRALSRIDELKRRAADGQVPAPTPTPSGKQVVAFEGDSLTVDYAGYFAGAYRERNPKVEVVNFAVGGSGLNEVLSRLPALVARKPDIAVLNIGTNDLGNADPASTYIAGLTQWASALRAIGCKPFIAHPLPVYVANNAVYTTRHNNKRAEVIVALNAMVGNKLEGVIPFGTHAVIGPNEAAKNTALFHDGAHLTERNGSSAGHDYALSALEDALRAHVPEQTPVPAPEPEPEPTPVPEGDISRALVPPGIQTGMAQHIPDLPPNLVADVPVVDMKVDPNAWMFADTPLPNGKASDINGAFRLTAQVTHGGNFDPIVFPGDPRPAGSHHHTFWGHPLADENTTYQSAMTANVVGSGEGGALNRSVKWMPSLLTENGDVIIPEYVTEYYKAIPAMSSPWFKGLSSADKAIINKHRPHIVDIDGKDTGRFAETVPIPQSLRYIMGNQLPAEFQANKNAKTVWWDLSCPAENWSKGSADMGSLVLMMEQGKTYELRMSINGAEGWNGIHVSMTDHHSHMSFIKWSPNGYSYLPETHPFVIPGIQMKPFWRITPEMGDPRKISYSCDIDVPGDRMHSEYMEGWHRPTLLRWHESNINGMKNSSAGNLGDGFVLKRPPCFNFGGHPNLIRPDSDGKFRLVDMNGNRLAS